MALITGFDLDMEEVLYHDASGRPIKVKQLWEATYKKIYKESRRSLSSVLTPLHYPASCDDVEHG